jgi:hypothetical protein
MRFLKPLLGVTVAAAVLLTGAVAEAKRIKPEEPPGWKNVRDIKQVGWARRGLTKPPGQASP